mmetsp:Transcript_19609/g.55157  ORF Transcript_19609/g.55157 Transcript_19609/m.55157 type:complete len:209 (+) Transcript_19609:350-976(+)
MLRTRAGGALQTTEIVAAPDVHGVHKCQSRRLLPVEKVRPQFLPDMGDEVTIVGKRKFAVGARVRRRQTGLLHRGSRGGVPYGGEVRSLRLGQGQRDIFQLGGDVLAREGVLQERTVRFVQESVVQGLLQAHEAVNGFLGMLVEPQDPSNERMQVRAIARAEAKFVDVHNMRYEGNPVLHPLEKFVEELPDPHHPEDGLPKRRQVIVG